MTRTMLGGPRLAVVVALYSPFVLYMHGRSGIAGEATIAVTTWLLLAFALWQQDDLWRTRALAVVVVATLGEVLGASLLGAYEYRDGYLPAFVPPGHGLVFLAGCGLAQSKWLRDNADHFVAAVCAVAVAWALLGATQTTGPDLFGALGVAIFIVIVLLARTELRPFYAGVFVAVSLLELAGTALGTWRWVEVSPLLGLPVGNPPSGVASGYCLFGLAGFAVAPWLVATAASTRRWAAAA